MSAYLGPSHLLTQQGMAFLHQNNIVHGDIRGQNMVMDVVVPATTFPPNYLAGIRGPARRYAFIDFETTVVYPEMSSDAVSRCKEDVRSTGMALEMHLR
ncbi:hypothetical protein C0991_005753, partial [Blastosporella zonata]